ncbi:MAG: TauD/TfdA family dioxygenase [Myxococcales bacterium]|nr:TauD/TfdA family dioxygenase [Myxococcales bacterium]
MSDLSSEPSNKIVSSSALHRAFAVASPVELHAGWLRVYFPMGTPRWADFHYLWLRHQCDRDRHPKTQERTIDPSEIAEDIRPLAAFLSPRDGGQLVVRWDEPSRRESIYSLVFLQQHAYAAEQPGPRPPPSDTQLITLDARRYQQPSVLVEDVLALLQSAGASIVRYYGRSHDHLDEPVDPDDTERLIEAFSIAGLSVVGTHFGRIEDLRTDNTTNQNTDQLGYTDASIEAHTDQPFLDEPPRYQLLHCIRAADSGGENYVVDAQAAAEYLAALDEDAYQLLLTQSVRFHRKQQAFERIVESPILTRRADGSLLVRYSYFTMAPQRTSFAKMDAFYRAYRRFAKLVREPRHQYRLRLAASDFLIYDNHRMLHARTGFTGPRWVRGVYFNP